MGQTRGEGRSSSEKAGRLIGRDLQKDAERRELDARYDALCGPVEVRYRLSDLYDADRRTRDPEVRDLAAGETIPHPLRGVQYADGIKPCTHAKRHVDGVNCPSGWGDDQ